MHIKSFSFEREEIDVTTREYFIEHQKRHMITRCIICNYVAQFEDMEISCKLYLDPNSNLSENEIKHQSTS